MELNHTEAMELAQIKADESNLARCYLDACAEIERLRGALITGASLLEQGCNAADMAASMRRAAGVPNA